MHVKIGQQLEPLAVEGLDAGKDLAPTGRLAIIFAKQGKVLVYPAGAGRQFHLVDRGAEPRLSNSDGEPPITLCRLYFVTVRPALARTMHKLNVIENDIEIGIQKR